MALFTESVVRARAARETTNYSKTAYAVLNERVERQNSIEQFDIFLSHAYDDRELLSGTVLLLEDFGYRIYLDWRNDPKLDRSQVIPGTAAVLRARMKASKCLFYSVTPGARDSAWMKWELGWKDGNNSRAAILPIEASGGGDIWGGQQFLGLYPYAADGAVQGGANRLWIHRSRTCYVDFDSWLKGAEPSEHAG